MTNDMALVDHYDIVLGTSDDGHPFLTVNSASPYAHNLLVNRGLTPRAHRERALYFPSLDNTFADACRLIEEAAGALFPVGQRPLSSVLDLRWTTHAMLPGSALEPNVRLHAGDLPVTATVHYNDPAIHRALEDAQFQPTSAGYALPTDMDEQDQAQACKQLHGELWVLDMPSETYLGIPSPASLAQLPYSGVSRTHAWTAAHIEGSHPSKALRAVLDHVNAHPIEPGAEGLYRLEERIDLLSHLAYRFASRAVRRATYQESRQPRPDLGEQVSSLGDTAGMVAIALAHYTRALSPLTALSTHPEGTATADAALRDDLRTSLLQAHECLDSALHTLAQQPIHQPKPAASPKVPYHPPHRRGR
ncbi:hypothetical protein [Streptomyces celluloflavus]|uniref:hypothetical protein n=1 Tax=Streptomyces celluloflavus TaxID=58344 RepID=UPI0034605742|nr:hypothetical protein OG717_29680 [Streptomyces celluloflavus]